MRLVPACRISSLFHEEETSESNSESERESIAKTLYLYGILIPLAQCRADQRHAKARKDRTDDNAESRDPGRMNKRMRKGEEAKSTYQSA